MKQIFGKFFKVWITKEDIQKEILRLAKEIETAYPDEKPVLLGILNGSFVFAADLIRELNGDYSIEFVKTSSYTGETAGEVQVLLGLPSNLYHKHILIIEDILDTGLTLQKIIQSLEKINPKSIKIAVMFDKPLARLNEIQADFIGKKIESKFIVGYGLDFDGLGRNLPEVYIEA